MLGKDRSNVGHLMQAMAEMGVLELKRTGVYALRNNIPTIPTVPTLLEEGKTGNSGNTGNDDGHAALLFDDQDNASELEHRAPRGSRTYEGRMAGS